MIEDMATLTRRQDYLFSDFIVLFVNLFTTPLFSIDKINPSGHIPYKKSLIANANLFFVMDASV